MFDCAGSFGAFSCYFESCRVLHQSDKMGAVAIDAWWGTTASSVSALEPDHHVCRIGANCFPPAISVCDSAGDLG